MNSLEIKKRVYVESSYLMAVTSPNSTLFKFQVSSDFYHKFISVGYTAFHNKGLQPNTFLYFNERQVVPPLFFEPGLLKNQQKQMVRLRERPTSCTRALGKLVEEYKDNAA